MNHVGLATTILMLNRMMSHPIVFGHAPSAVFCMHPVATRCVINDWIDSVPMKSLIQELTNDRMTAEKAVMCASKGFAATGVVMRSYDGRCCIIEMGAVRWLEADEMWAVMHPQTNR